MDTQMIFFQNVTTVRRNTMEHDSRFRLIFFCSVMSQKLMIFSQDSLRKRHTVGVKSMSLVQIL